MNDWDVFILSAGLGERLRPITLSIPKVLVPVLGEPVILKIYGRLKSYGFERFYVNAHYQAEKIERFFKGFEDLTVIKEPEILGTGGGLVNMAKSARGKFILAHNGDILTEFNIKDFVKFHINEDSDITLAVGMNVPFKNLMCDGKSFAGIGSGKYGFTGVAIYKRELLLDYEVKNFDAKEIWLDALNKGKKVLAYDVSDAYWADLGTPDNYARAVFDKMREEGEYLFISKRVNQLSKVFFDGFFVIDGNPLIEEGASFRNVVIIGDCYVKGERYENCIVSEGGIAEFDEYRTLGDGEKYPVGFGGSDRKFYRIKREEKSFILCEYGNDREGLQRHIKATEFLKECEVPVPEISEVYDDRNVLLMEDFGDLNFYTYFKYPLNTDDFLFYYKKAIEVIAKLHALGPKTELCHNFDDFVFDYEYFKWEQAHFLNNFVKRFTNLTIDEEVNRELDELARECAEFPKVVLHRDYQSQNIMIRDDEIGVLDFTSLRWGPKAYDLASLLYDPYMPELSSLRDELTDYYLVVYNYYATKRLSRSELEGELNFMRLQRHMQALGAYGFLSEIKGKKYFRRFIPFGLSLLEEDFHSFVGKFGNLRSLVSFLKFYLIKLGES